VADTPRYAQSRPVRTRPGRPPENLRAASQAPVRGHPSGPDRSLSRGPARSGALASAQRADASLRAGPAPSARTSGNAAVPAWRRHTEILGNAGTLIGAAGISAVLGFAFWAVAARLFSQAAVGYASATTSAMTLLGTVGMFGMGTFLLAELPRRAGRANLVAASMLTAGLGALLLGSIFVLVAPHLSASLRNSDGTLIGALILVAGVALSAATFVFDQASIALLRGGLQLARNIALASAKLLLLPVAAYVLHDQFGTGIALSWVLATAISVVPVAIWLWWRGSHVLAQPDWTMLRRMRTTVLTYNWLSLAVMAPTLLTPILVTVLVSPAANGAFYAAWMMVSMLNLVPTNLSTVLFAVASNDPQALARKLRFTLGLSYLLGLPGMAVLGLGGHFALSIFGPGYVHEALLPLSLLVIAYVPIVPRTHYIAVSRATGKINQAATLMTVVAIMEMTAIAVGAKWDGLVGLSLALVGMKCLTGIVVTPTVVRAAMGRGRHRRGELAPETGEADLMGHAAGVTATSQQAALAILLLMSRPE
jgi:O-antigen/teichoic acid export membrane protein